MKQVEPTRWARRLRDGQVAELYVLDVTTGTYTMILSSSDILIEAPNWHPDGHWIVVNGDGVLFKVDTDAPSALQPIDCNDLPELNNDHVIAPDGSCFYVSANDGHLYRLSFSGGVSERLTTDKAPERRFRHFLHGVSPDNRVLLYVGTEDRDGDEWGTRAIWSLDLESGDERMVGGGYSPADGPEFGPDGTAVFFNSEFRSPTDGHAQLFRHEIASGNVDQLTSDERVNWFPHPSPDGTRLVYLSYPPGTVGHPPDVEVELRALDLPAGSPDTLVTLFGGQGTINVPSWSPDSTRLAYVAYPISSTGE